MININIRIPIKRFAFVIVKSLVVPNFFLHSSSFKSSSGMVKKDLILLPNP